MFYNWFEFICARIWLPFLVGYGSGHERAKTVDLGRSETTWRNWRTAHLTLEIPFLEAILSSFMYVLGSSQFLGHLLSFKNAHHLQTNNNPACDCVLNLPTYNALRSRVLVVVSLTLVFASKV